MTHHTLYMMDTDYLHIPNRNIFDVSHPTKIFDLKSTVRDGKIEDRPPGWSVRCALQYCLVSLRESAHAVAPLDSSIEDLIMDEGANFPGIHRSSTFLADEEHQLSTQQHTRLRRFYNFQKVRTLDIFVRFE